MRALIQRVSEASVKVDAEYVGRIGGGLLILLGVEERDGEEDIAWLISKIVKLRIFNDETGNMNLSLKEASRSCLVVSQFTLHASTKKGNRPSFHRSAKPEVAKELYEQFVKEFQTLGGISVEQGVFGAMMEVGLVNDGPVTIMLDSKLRE